jgi:hypothetical protein
METYHSTRSSRKTTPYNPLTARCPKCRAPIGRRCVSSLGNAIRYSHRQRTEAAAAEFRSAVRLQILDRTRRHPFACAFSPRRLADADCFDVRIPKRKAAFLGGESRPGVSEN